LAISSLESQLAGDPSMWPYRELLAEMRARQEGRTGEVHSSHEETFDAPNTAEGWYLRSLATLDPHRALECTREALDRDPGYPPALESMMRLSMLTGDLRGALDGAERLIEQEPLLMDWRRYKAELLMRLGRYENAVEFFNELIESESHLANRPSLLHGRAQAHRSLKEFAEATRDYTAAIEILGGGKRAAWTYYQRATPRWILGQHVGAISDCREAYRHLGYASFANARLFLILRELDRREEAEAALAEAREHVWEDPWLERILACLDEELSPDELARAADPEDPKQLCEGYYYAGEACLLNGQIEQARRWFLRCTDTNLDTDPDQHDEPMSEYELAEWRLDQLSAEGSAGASHRCAAQRD
jgi:tetratricopeptide (TPR) repeat protein